MKILMINIVDYYFVSGANTINYPGNMYDSIENDNISKICVLNKYEKECSIITK